MHPFHFVRNRKLWLLVGLVVGTLLPTVLAVTAQGPRPGEALHATFVARTGFTYQGQLKSSGAPFNGMCGFQFALYDSPNLGTQVGMTRTLASVPVTGGLFTVNIDFDTGAITGDPRWLDIQASCPSNGVYAPLTPRQQLTPAPMALALPGLWTQQNPTSTNLIGGFSGNLITPTLVGATIGGGGTTDYPNRAWANYATVGGGVNNTASDIAATIGGGGFNTASGNGATIGGGSAMRPAATMPPSAAAWATSPALTSAPSVVAIKITFLAPALTIPSVEAVVTTPAIITPPSAGAILTSLAVPNPPSAAVTPTPQVAPMPLSQAAT